MKRAFLIAAALLVAPLMSVSAALPHIPLPMETPEVSPRVVVGSTEEVCVCCNPSTGYGWYVIDTLPEDAPVSLTVDYVPTDELLCGAPGYTRVRLHGLRPGKISVRLGYLRPHEEGVPPLRTLTLVIDVVPAEE